MTTVEETQEQVDQVLQKIEQRTELPTTFERRQYENALVRDG